MNICHLTPYPDFTLAFVERIAMVCSESGIDVQQEIHNLDGNAQGDSGKYWDMFRKFDIIHIYKLFSDAGLHAVTVARSMNKWVIGFDDWNSFHAISMKAGIGLINAFHARDHLSAGMISAIYTGPVRAINVTDEDRGGKLLRLYRDICGNESENITAQ